MTGVSEMGMRAPTHWFSGQRIRHVANLNLGRVAAVDFGESLVAVQINEMDPLVWWRMENVVEVTDTTKDAPADRSQRGRRRYVRSAVSSEGHG